MSVNMTLRISSVSRPLGLQTCRTCAFVAGKPKPSLPGRARRFSLAPHCSSNETSTSTVPEETAAGANGVEPSEAQPTAVTSVTGVPPELDFTEPGAAQRALTSFRLLFALPWRRFKQGSALTVKLGGAIAEQPQSRFSSTTSLPALCDSLIKAAYDPRVVGLVVKIDPLECGWGKILELRRHIEMFRKSGKWTIAYLERAGEKEYFLASAFQEIYAPPSASLSLRGFSVTGSFLRGVFDKIGIEPEVRRIGKFKSAGDQLLRTDMSDAQREQLSALLDDIYSTVIDGLAIARGKTREDVEALLNEGVYDMTKFLEGGWVDGLKYEDEINDIVCERTGGDKEKLRVVGLRKYSRVGRSAFGLDGGKTIAIVRTSGAIVGGSGGTGTSTITSGAVISQLRALKKDKSVAAVVLRVDSPGGDALASDLMWREIRKLCEEKPVIASMADVAASGGYYMSMACRKIVAEALTLTGSIGVVTGKFSLAQLYEKIGYSKETLSRGKYAQLLLESRRFSEEEAILFDAAAQHAYEQFRNKAAESRGMEIVAMQEVAQGRVWSGQQASTVGLVDAIGGINRAVALAKEAAGIEPQEKVRLREVSRASLSPLSLLAGTGAAWSMWQAGLAFMSLFSQMGGSSTSSVAGAVGAPVLLETILAARAASNASGVFSQADQILTTGLASGTVMAQLPELTVDGVSSRALSQNGMARETKSQSELFID